MSTIYYVACKKCKTCMRTFIEKEWADHQWLWHDPKVCSILSFVMDHSGMCHMNNLFIISEHDLLSNTPNEKNEYDETDWGLWCTITRLGFYPKDLRDACFLLIKFLKEIEEIEKNKS